MNSKGLLARLRALADRGVETISARLGWNRAYRSLSYLRSALWVIPIVAVVLALAFVRAIQLLDHYVTWDLTGLGVEGPGPCSRPSSRSR